jgi:TPR repeat protein
MIRPLTIATIACLCAASLQIAIWSGLVAGRTTLVGSALGDASTTLEPATEPRSALTSPSDLLNRDVAAAREEIPKLNEAWRQTSAAQSARAIADLSAAREEIGTLRARHREAEKKASDAVEKQVQERARAEALDRALIAAGQEIQTLETRQSDGAQQISAVGQQSAQEHARAEALDRDLAAARQEIQTLKVDQANAAQDASAAERTRERARGEVLAGNLAAVREENRTTVRADAVADNTSVPQPPNEIAASLRRGDALIASGDFAAARLVLRRAADAGDARAAMTLAETYDPAILEKLGVHGVVPDLAMARGWYEKAKKLGATEATQRLELLASKQH